MESGFRLVLEVTCKAPTESAPRLEKLIYPGAKFCGSMSVLRKTFIVEYSTCTYVLQRMRDGGEAESEGRVTPVSRLSTCHTLRSATKRRNLQWSP